MLHTGGAPPPGSLFTLLVDYRLLSYTCGMYIRDSSIFTVY